MYTTDTVKASANLAPLRLVSRIGSGSNGIVYRGVYDIDNQSSKEFAVKCIPRLTPGRKQLTDAMVFREVTNWRAVTSIILPENETSNHIIPLIDVRYDIPSESTYLVSELATYGTLQTRIWDEVTGGLALTYSDRLRILLHVATGIRSCHNRGIAHCDIKPGNIVHAGTSLDKPIWKLIDFGHSQCCTRPDAGLSARRYTPFYAAPEAMVDRLYGTAVDMWAFGVMAYGLFNRGIHPMLPSSHVNNVDGTGMSSLKAALERGVIRWPISGYLSESAMNEQHGNATVRDLIEKCLSISPNDRIDADRAIQMIQNLSDDV